MSQKIMRKCSQAHDKRRHKEMQEWKKEREINRDSRKVIKKMKKQIEILSNQKKKSKNQVFKQ